MKIVGLKFFVFGLFATGRVLSQAVPSPEFTYDVNGNMKADANKNITSIHYNILNLPDTITYSDGTKVLYIYSATGQKLSEVLLSPEATVVQKRDYIHDFIFKGDTLESIDHAEGRTMPTLPGNPASMWEYQYHITDHLGNVRMTVTSQMDTLVYQASMEREQNANEEIFFDGIDKHRAPFVNANHTPKGKEVARLPNETENGISMNLAVKKGDIIYAQTNAYYEGPVEGDGLQSEQKPLTTILSFVTGFTSGGASVLSESQRSIFSAGSATGVATGKTEGTEAPVAHLNYQLFNSSFKLIDAGFKAVTKEASFSQELLKIDPIVIDETGYLHVYLSNTTEKNVPVYFDDLKVTHILSPIVQEDGYDPFGMTLAEQHDRRLDEISNRHLFNGKELLEAGGLNWYDYGARMYDAALGRWHVTDLLAEKYASLTPYHYAMNNPVNLVDPDGHDVVFHQSGTDRIRYQKLITAMTWLKNTHEGKRILSQAHNNKNITVYVAGTHNIKDTKGDPSNGLTTATYGKNFNKNRRDWVLDLQDIRILATNYFNVFVGLDLAADVKKNKDVYFVIIDVDKGGNRDVAHILGHELEAHVNINQSIKQYIKSDNKIDVNVNGRITQMLFGDYEHLTFGSAFLNKNYTPIISRTGTSAERLHKQLSSLWTKKISQQFTPRIIQSR